MEWVERPWTVQSPEELDPDWRVALDRYKTGAQCGGTAPPGKDSE